MKLHSGRLKGQAADEATIWKVDRTGGWLSYSLEG